MIYRPRPPKKWFFSYIAPFLLIVLIFVWGVYSFKQLLFKDNDTNTWFFSDSYAVLNAEKWATEVMLAWTNDWKLSPTKMKLFKWDAIKTYKKWARIDLPSTISFAMDINSSLIIDKIEADNSFKDISVSLISWRIWLNAERMINPKSKLSLAFQDLVLTTRWWIFSVEANTIRVISWEGLIDIVDSGKIVWQMNIWIGQELIMWEGTLSEVRIWKLPQVSAMSDEFRMSSWYKENYSWTNNRMVESNPVLNAIKEEELIAKELKESEGDNSVTGGDLADNNQIDNATKQADKSSESGDKAETWTLTIDIKSSTIELKKDEMYSIVWTNSSNVAFIKVNWYRLSKFRLWNTSYKYNTRIDWKNLEVWDNIFKVEAFDKKGNLMIERQAKVTVKMADAKLDESSNWEEEDKQVEKVEQAIDQENVVQDSGWVLQVIFPKEWEVVNADTVEVKWLAPEWAVAIYVWEYKLTKFKKWDKEFVYRAAPVWWNLTAWAKNTFLIKALDADWNIIESVKLSFFVEEKGVAKPVEEESSDLLDGV